MKKTGYLAFVLIFFVLCLLPSVGMLGTTRADQSESGDEILVPQVRNEDGTINYNYMGDMGDYFAEQFAFRENMIDLNSRIYRTVFHTAVTDQVVFGEDGWVFYKNTLNDFTSTHQMPDRGLRNAVHNLKLIQQYTEAHGSRFLLAIAPNKNSLYGDHMPYFYKDSDVPNNYERLIPMLQEAGIPYADLMGAFEEQEEELYLKQDSHWNNKGACLAYNTIMDGLGASHETYEDVPAELQKVHQGDLISMVYPASETLEEDYVYEKDWTYQYDIEVKNNMDDWIETSSPNGTGTLLMYRDSFCESMLPFFAEAYQKAYFTRLVPYDLTDIETRGVDHVVVERTQRRIESFAEDAAIVPAQKAADSVRTAYLSGVEYLPENTGTMELTADGNYYYVSGVADPSYMSVDTDLYLSVTREDGSRELYEVYYLNKKLESGMTAYAYGVFITPEQIGTGVVGFDLIICRDGVCRSAAQMSYRF